MVRMELFQSPAKNNSNIKTLLLKAVTIVFVINCQQIFCFAKLLRRIFYKFRRERRRRRWNFFPFFSRINVIMKVAPKRLPRLIVGSCSVEG